MSDESSDLSDSSDQACNFSNNLDLNGKILGNYNIIHEIGRGGYSIVWLALHIGTQKYFALKVQEPDSFKDGMDEVQFVSTLPTSPPYFNNIIEYFTHINNKKKYLCSVFHLHATNLDSMIRNGGYGDGFGVEISNKIMNQMIGALTILHNNYKVFHGDIKPDNIFLKGTSPRDKKIIELYNSFNFVEKYKKAKLEFWLNKKNSPNSIDKMKIKLVTMILFLSCKDHLKSKDLL